MPISQQNTPSSSSTPTTTSLYDPEEEFQEIGIKYSNKTFWKIYGPKSCDAVTDNAGASLILMHNALDHLAGIVSQQGTIYNDTLPSSYGPQITPTTPLNLLSYAQSLSWHSQSQDLTGLIWMGARYYDPKGGRFLSPDPIGHPICLDLYAYADGDPVNHLERPLHRKILIFWMQPIEYKVIMTLLFQKRSAYVFLYQSYFHKSA